MASESSVTTTPLTIVLVEALDRRVLPALALAPQLHGDVRAVHIALDADVSHRLARGWMDLGITWPPLHIEEPPADTLLGCVRAVVERCAVDRELVTVLVPEKDLNRWWQPLLHRGAGRAIAWELRGIRNVTTAVLPVGITV